MLSKQVREAYIKMTTTTDTIAVAPHVQQYKRYCEDELGEIDELKGINDPSELDNDTLTNLATASLELMMDKADELGLTDAEFITAMTFMAMNEAIENGTTRF